MRRKTKGHKGHKGHKGRKGAKAAILLVAVFLIFGTLGAFAQEDSAGAGQEAVPEGSYGSKIADQVLIQVDPETGSLIVITDEETSKHIDKVIKSLDTPIPQVLINVLFLEVTHNKGFDLGLEMASVIHGGTDESNKIQTIVDMATQKESGFYRVISDDLDITLRALAQTGTLEVLSRPSILTKHNKEAIITVGKEVPFIRNSRITQDGQILNTVEYEDIGIILRVTPYITSDGLVEMDLSPEISALTGETVPISQGVASPVFAKRSAQTRVVVADGKTVVIGGLMEDNKTNSVYKVPVLGDIPFLGVLFRRTSERKTKTELLIFLTPKVLLRQAQLTDMTNDQKRRTEFVPDVLSQDTLNKYLDKPQE